MQDEQQPDLVGLSAEINEHDVFDHLRDSSSPCERAIPNSYLLTSWLCRRFRGLGNYSCVLPRILLSESLC